MRNDPVVVANCIQGPGDLSDWIKTAFQGILRTLDGVPGVHEFHLRKLDLGDGTFHYASLTVWESMQHFGTWRQSIAFLDAYADRRRQREFKRLTAVRHDIPLTPGLTGAALDAELLSRINARNPGLLSECASSAMFTEEACWSAAGLTQLPERTGSKDELGHDYLNAPGGPSPARPAPTHARAVPWAVIVSAPVGLPPKGSHE
ncbi:antibiotic biosynthesis monooxygenase family protein [Wenjunlia tyrosinilytica]|uniref:ABM domain-containing protein n=1 Tax=Wenjunlia tyrosinilytica TaxID=1544741 RepID=A0A918A0S8_9ACTN|nr:hypothetical protein GCM10012280_71740 [Wenjunlia tyrosinilytica]